MRWKGGEQGRWKHLPPYLTPNPLSFVSLITYLSQTHRVPCAFHFHYDIFWNTYNLTWNFGEGFVYFQINESREATNEEVCLCVSAFKKPVVCKWGKELNKLHTSNNRHENVPSLHPIVYSNRLLSENWDIPCCLLSLSFYTYFSTTAFTIILFP